MKAIWNGTVLADSNQVLELDGYNYFPLASVRQEFLKPSFTTSTCPWKGSAKYFSVTVNGHENSDAAWIYEPKTRCIRNQRPHRFLARRGNQEITVCEPDRRNPRAPAYVVNE